MIKFERTPCRLLLASNENSFIHSCRLLLQLSRIAENANVEVWLLHSAGRAALEGFTGVFVHRSHPLPEELLCYIRGNVYTSECSAPPSSTAATRATTTPGSGTVSEGGAANG